MRAVFKEQIPHAGNATTFIFVPQEPLTWIAGQSIKIALQGPYGPIEHRFSISSAPYQQHIAITTRQSGSQYKKRLFALQPGETVEAYALEGDFTWRKRSAPTLLVAAGIGVTPYMSMLRQRTHEGGRLEARLLYATPDEHIVFKQELAALANANPGLTVKYQIGKRLTARNILQVLHPDCQLIYLSGPSAMVDELSAGLIASGIPESWLLRDWFTGKLPQEGL